MVRRSEADTSGSHSVDGVAERMKERQDAEHDVVVAEPEQGVCRIDVRQHVAVGQHHALRDAVLPLEKSRSPARQDRPVRESTAPRARPAAVGRR